MTDAQLISDYVATGSNDAFAQLFNRHIDWVYAVALRRSGGDIEMARDVAQAVFILVARKAARLPTADAALAAWLFRATTLTSKAALKSAARRRRHERMVAAMRTEMLDESSQSASWTDLAPQLDALVERLSVKDRQAILLRFYQRKSIRGVAEDLGISEAAAHKRVSRAVERLRGYFHRRGSVLPAAAFVELLSDHISPPGASGMNASAITRLLADAATAPASILANSAGRLIAWWAWVKSAVAAALLVSVIGGIILVAGAARNPSTRSPAAQPHWLHVRWRPGDEAWAELSNRVTFHRSVDPNNLSIIITDYARGVRHRYHSNAGPMVYEEKPEVPAHSTIDLAIALTMWRRADDRVSEPQADTLDGRPAVRIDVSRNGPGDLSAVVARLWLDAAARQPLRAERLRANDPMKYERAAFDVPATGPATLEDLGIPAGIGPLPNDGKSPAAQKILDTAAKAAQSLPQNLRIITWQLGLDEQAYQCAVLHRRGSSVRSDYYRPATTGQPIPLTPAEALAWAADSDRARHVACEICSPAGRFQMTFDKSGREPAALVAYQGDNEWALAEIENALHLRPYGTISGPLDVMPAPATAAAAATAPTTRPANILLRRQDAQSRFDYLLDPARDYLCVRQVRYARHGQEWREESWSALSDLQQLPGGGSGWYGRQIVYFGTPFRASVEVLNDSDFPPDLFNGDKLIVELRRAGKSVTFNPW